MRFPHYVKSDAERSLMENSPICSALLEWHRELVKKRNDLREAHKFSAAVGMWKSIAPVWLALRHNFERVSNLDTAAA